MYDASSAWTPPATMTGRFASGAWFGARVVVCCGLAALLLYGAIRFFVPDDTLAAPYFSVFAYVTLASLAIFQYEGIRHARPGDEVIPGITPGAVTLGFVCVTAGASLTGLALDRWLGAGHTLAWIGTLMHQVVIGLFMLFRHLDERPRAPLASEPASDAGLSGLAALPDEPRRIEVFGPEVRVVRRTGRRQLVRRAPDGGAWLRTGEGATAGIVLRATACVALLGGAGALAWVLAAAAWGANGRWSLWLLMPWPLLAAAFALGWLGICREMWRGARLFAPGELRIADWPLVPGVPTRVEFRREAGRPLAIERIESYLACAGPPKPGGWLPGGDDVTVWMTPLPPIEIGGEVRALTGSWEIRLPTELPDGLAPDDRRLAWYLEVCARLDLERLPPEAAFVPTVSRFALA